MPQSTPMSGRQRPSAGRHNLLVRCVVILVRRRSRGIMRTISLAAVALLGAALLAPVGTAAAAGETCQGQAATIVGTPGGQITGTEGADVIVTNDADRVDALGGDDLVCATGGSRRTTYSVIAILGAGADTFIPSERGGSTIYAGTVDGTDTEADVIRSSGTGGLVISGMAGQPNADIIDLGNGIGEVRWSGIQTAPGAVSVGPGGFGILSVRSANGDVDDGRQRHGDGGRHGAHLDGPVRPARFSPRRPSTDGSRSAEPTAPSASRSTRRRRMTATSRSAAATTSTSRTAWAVRRRGSRATVGPTHCCSTSIATTGCAPT